MSFEDILNIVFDDMIDDFVVDANLSFDRGLVQKVLIYVVKPLVGNLSVGEIYTICSRGICELIITYGDLSGVSEKELIGTLREFFSQPLGIILANSEAFKWIPKQLEEIYVLSFSIFKAARRLYNNRAYEDDKCNIDIMFKDILKLREELDSLDYVYRPKSEVLDFYETEISECKLDIEYIKGDKSKISKRLNDYINYSLLNFKR